MNDREPPKRKLRLYVAGMSARSSVAIANICAICEQQYKDDFELEIIDIYQQMDMAEQDNIVAAPTLIRMLPAPLRRLIGDMTDKEKVLLVMDT
jgi:circadian clock protein KaiB